MSSSDSSVVADNVVVGVGGNVHWCIGWFFLVFIVFPCRVLRGLLHPRPRDRGNLVGRRATAQMLLARTYPCTLLARDDGSRSLLKTIRHKFSENFPRPCGKHHCAEPTDYCVPSYPEGRR